MRAFVVVLAASLVVPFESVSAQEPPQTERSSRALCFRGEPLPSCRSFWITEVGYVYGLAVPQYMERHSATWELGLMTNRGGHSAIGATLYAAIAHGGSGGLKARYRRWLNNSTSIDFSPGILLRVGERKAPGFTGHVGLTYRDELALVSQWDVVTNPWHWDGYRQVSRSEVYWSGGVKLGSKPALYGAALEAAAVLAVIVWVIIACSGGGCWS